MVPLLLNNFNRVVEKSSQMKIPGPLTPEIDLPLPVGNTVLWVTDVDLKI